MSETAPPAVVQVEIPSPLRVLASTDTIVTLTLDRTSGPPTQGALVAALEESFPALRGTVRDPATNSRRAYLRFFADNEDISHHGLAAPLPESVLTGKSVFMIVGAVSGG